MKVIYNTNDNVYIGDDVKEAFRHAYNLGKSEWSGNIDTAYQEWAREYMNNQMNPVTKEEIAIAIAKVLGTNTYAMLDQDFGRSGKVSEARMYLCWFLYLYIDESVQELADFMGYQNHSSVLYGAGKISDMLEYENTQKKVTGVKTKTIIDMIKAILFYRNNSLKYVHRSYNNEDKNITIV